MYRFDVQVCLVCSTIIINTYVFCFFINLIGVQDHIFTAKQVIEKNRNNNMYVAYVDIEKEE